MDGKVPNKTKKTELNPRFNGLQKVSIKLALDQDNSSNSFSQKVLCDINTNLSQDICCIIVSISVIRGLKFILTGCEKAKICVNHTFTRDLDFFSHLRKYLQTFILNQIRHAVSHLIYLIWFFNLRMELLFINIAQ